MPHRWRAFAAAARLSLRFKGASKRGFEPPSGVSASTSLLDTFVGSDGVALSVVLV